MKILTNSIQSLDASDLEVEIPLYNFLLKVLFGLENSKDVALNWLDSSPLFISYRVIED